MHAFTDSPESFLHLQGWHLARPQGGSQATGTAIENERKPVEVVEGRMQGKGLVCHLAGVDDRTAAENLRGYEFWVQAERLPALEEGEFYWRDLVGLRVYTDGTGESAAPGVAGEQPGAAVLLGEVDHLLETGANDVLVLRPCAGSIDKRERLIPYLPGEVVLAVEPGQGAMHVRWHPDD